MWPLRDPPGVLGAIVARARADLAQREAARPTNALSRALAQAPAPRDFEAALRGSSLRLIAELKPRSPSAGALRPAADPADFARRYARHAHAMSVLCEGPHFGGSRALLTAARGIFPGPVLCKDFIFSEVQLDEARAAGADAALLMVCLLPPARLRALLAHAHALGLSALVETHDDGELAEALDAGARIIGVNSRDLRTLKVDLAGMLPRLARIPEDRIRVAESGLETAADVARLAGLADAALIGSALMRAPDPAQAMEALGFPAWREAGA